jgi:D-serine deaminase-like pyridoxal phosphate-dependent protein
VKIEEIDTPALLIDLDAMERNLSKMTRAFASGPTRLRPHYKNHKSPVLARRQLSAGAIGMTCATLSEAEALVSEGITDILISSELAGGRKIARLVELARQAGVKAVVDNPQVAAEMGNAATAKGIRLGVLVNVDVGQHRCGVLPGNAVVELARTVLAAGLQFRGLMGYEGHISHLREGPEKDRAYCVAMDALMECRSSLAVAGIPVGIVSTGGTGTYGLAYRYQAITESQAGSFLLMDTNYAATCDDFERTLTVLGTVISVTDGQRIVVDAGVKSISGERGMPIVKSGNGLSLRKLNAEHGIIDTRADLAAPKVGETLEIWVHYSDATVNLHDRMYGVRNGTVEEIFKLRG